MSTKQFVFTPGSQAINTDVHRCSSCERPMVSRRRLKELGEARGDFIAHAAGGICTTCDGRIRRAAARPETGLKVTERTAKQKAADQARVAESAYLREEWAWLKSFGVSPEEAARRLNLSVRTIHKYDEQMEAS